MDEVSKVRHLRRFVGLSALIVASVLGGAAAGCWLLAGNERLLGDGARLPWRRICLLVAVVESGLFGLVAMQWIPYEVAFEVTFGLVVLLCWYSQRRYGHLRRRTLPLDARDATFVGCLFLVVHLALVGGVIWWRWHRL